MQGLSAAPRPDTHLPAGGAVAVTLVLEVGDGAHHPLVDLRQREPLLGGALDSLADELGVGLVAPGIAPGAALPRRRAARPRPLGPAGPRRRRAACSLLRRAGRAARLRLGPRQRPGAGARAALRLKVRVDVRRRRGPTRLRHGRRLSPAGSAGPATPLCAPGPPPPPRRSVYQGAAPLAAPARAGHAGSGSPAGALARSLARPADYAPQRPLRRRAGRAPRRVSVAGGALM